MIKNFSFISIAYDAKPEGDMFSALTSLSFHQFFCLGKLLIYILYADQALEPLANLDKNQ